MTSPALSASVTRRSMGSWFRLLPVYAFGVALATPLEASFFVGPMRLSPYRIVLILALLPCVTRLLSGRVVRLQLFDWLIILHVGWAVLALTVNHGIERTWEFSGVYMIETLGAYLLARCYIRSAADFEAFARFMFLIVLLLLPLGAYEAITGDLLRNPANQPEPRLGLTRAYGPFDHPIHFGVFCASVLGIVFYALKDRVSLLGRLMRATAISVAVFLSLSSGPLTALTLQACLIAWNRLTRRIRGRWKIFAGGFLFSWITIDLLSNRTPIEVFISYLTFSAHNSYNRVLIWQFGGAEVMRHPIFGIGQNDWQRPEWMNASVDNFWLLEAMRFGLPGLILLAFAILFLCITVARRQELDRYSANCRAGWLISIVGLFVAGATVHYWDALFCLFIFLVGSGAWLTDAKGRRPRRG